MSLSGCSYLLAKGGGAVGSSGLSSSCMHSSIVLSSNESAYPIGITCMSVNNILLS